ncbi:MAG TPA: chemotaxis protein CheW [Methylotenera sp.]
MAKTSNLREFQEAILAKLKDAANQVGTESSSRLGVIVGTKRFLINLNEVKEVLPVPPILSVPLTKSWFLGTTNVRGNLYNVSDLAQFLNMPPTAKSVNNRIMLLSTETTAQVALLVDGLVGLRSVQEMHTESDNDESKQLFSKQKLSDADANEWYELDTESLVQDKNFIQPV